MHDTIKKPQDILDVGYTVRYPHLVNVTGVADIDAEVSHLSDHTLYSNLTEYKSNSAKQKIEGSSLPSSDWSSKRSASTSPFRWRSPM